MKNDLKKIAPIIDKKVQVKDDRYADGGYEGIVYGVTKDGIYLLHPFLEGYRVEEFSKCEIID